MSEQIETGAEPVGTTAPDEAEPSTFTAMGLRPELLATLEEMGFALPMEVQRVTYRRVMAGRDLLVQSRTGSGKTAAFGIPFAQGLVDTTQPRVQALALCPTRELALQVATECDRIGARVGLKVAAIYGGAPMGRQIEQLRDGAQLVAGTPGRVLDHLRRGTLVLDGLKILVLDECDEMLSMGFYEEISEILKRCPKDRQTMLFSATIPEEIERISARHMREPEKLTLSGDFIGVQQITHCYYMVSGMGRARDLVRVLEIEKPDSAIVFCNTREETSLVAEFLRNAGLDAEAISSDLSQKDRERVMGRMRAQNLKYLVATDIAARGIDISDLSHVINFTFPESAEVYVHRTGRTGRAGKSGVAISLISPRELGNFYYLKLTYKIRPEERSLPTEEEESTRRDGERMERLAREVGAAKSPGEEWRRLARRALATDGGEAILATLLENWFKAAPGAEPVAPIPVPAPVMSDAGSGESRGRRGERRGEGRGRERGGDRKRERTPGDREERPRRDRSAAEPGVETRDALMAADAGTVSEAPARNHAPSGETATGRTRTAASAATSDAVGAAPAGEAAAGAPSAGAAATEPGGEEKRKRRRRTRGGGGSERTATPREGASRSSRPAAPTIEAGDGREFWEVWAEDHDGKPLGVAAAPAAASAPAPGRSTSRGAAAASGAPSEARDEPADEPGTVRLYFNLGRRDGLRPEEIEAFVAGRGARCRRLLVRNSHTYLVTDEADADATVAALSGTRHNERDLLCERARR